MSFAPTTTRHGPLWRDADQSLLPLITLGLIVVTVALLVVGLEAPPARTAAAVATAHDFSDRIASYAALRERVETAVPRIRVTIDAGEILGREHQLALAMQAARPAAAQGDLFSAAAVSDFHRIIATDLARRSPSARAALLADVPAELPRVNRLYPVALPLATFPAALLQALPRLPADLEYRFMAGHLVIRDVRSNLIVDYLPDVTAQAGAQQS